MVRVLNTSGQYKKITKPLFCNKLVNKGDSDPPGPLFSFFTGYYRMPFGKLSYKFVYQL